MYKLLAQLIISATITSMGISAAKLVYLAFHEPKAMHELSKRVVSVDWRPVSVFPKEARRFR